jgi:hypothetical protein
MSESSRRNLFLALCALALVHTGARVASHQSERTGETGNSMKEGQK